VAATFEWVQKNGLGGVLTQLGSSGNLANFKNVDTAGIASYTSNPISAGNNSYEVWLLGHFTGSFNRIDGCRFWMSTNYSPSTGLHIFFKGDQFTYLQPANGTSSIATSSIPQADPGTANVSIGASLSGSLVASGYTDHLVLQMRTDTNAPAGDTSLATYTLTYNEN
jgi:hypothetical protein